MNDFYSSLEKDINVIEDLKFNDKVHAQNNKNKLLHRWIHYKEGFSEELIDFYLSLWNINKGKILDPFAGSGTTLLQSQSHGIESIGFEVNPFSHLVVEVKLMKWNKEDIVELVEHITYLRNTKVIEKEYELPGLPRINDIFEEPFLSQLLFYREYIFNIENQKIHKFMLVGFLSILEYNSNARKFCSGLRYIQRKNKNVFKQLFEKYNMMLEDIEAKNYYAPSSVILDTCLNGDKYIENGTIDAFITSPPYANTFDYTNIYKIELWFGQFIKNREDLSKLRKQMIRSHVSTKPIEDFQIANSNLNIKNELKFIIDKISEQKLWNNHIPRMIWAYFEDMNILLKNMSNALKEHGKGALVVANSVYNGYVVPTDLFISKIAEQYNLKTTAIRVARYIDYENSNNNRKSLCVDSKYIRETIVEFEKISE